MWRENEGKGREKSAEKKKGETTGESTVQAENGLHSFYKTSRESGKRPQINLPSHGEELGNVQGGGGFWPEEDGEESVKSTGYEKRRQIARNPGNHQRSHLDIRVGGFCPLEGQRGEGGKEGVKKMGDGGREKKTPLTNLTSARRQSDQKGLLTKGGQPRREKQDPWPNPTGSVKRKGGGTKVGSDLFHPMWVPGRSGMGG